MAISAATVPALDRSKQGLLAASAGIVFQLRRCLCRPRQRRFRQARHAGGPCTAGFFRIGLRLWHGDVLCRLSGPRNTRHADRREVERTQMDQPDHDLVGDRGGDDGLCPLPRARSHLVGRVDRTRDRCLVRAAGEFGPGVAISTGRVDRRVAASTRQPVRLAVFRGVLSPRSG